MSAFFGSAHLHSDVPISSGVPTNQNLSNPNLQRNNRMKSLWIALCLFACACMAFGQAGSGTITGTIADPAGAVIANASVEARNTETGVVFPVVSTATGNYTVSQLPVGQYEVSATVPGFKKYVRSGIGVAAAQVVRIDIGLEVG